MKLKVIFLSIVLAFFSIPNFAQNIVGPPQNTTQDKQTLKQVVEKALKSYVFVDASGSGVVISADGYVITNDHVAGEASTWRVRTSDGVMRYADLIGTDPYGDIALLKIRDVTDLPFIEMGDSDIVSVGQNVIAVGNPFGMGDLDEKPTVTIGIISALHRFHFNYTDAIMTDAPLNPGNSGGPLITLDGKLIGINGQIDNRFEIRVSSGIGYAVTSNQIKRFLPHLKKSEGGFVYHAQLKGVTLYDIEDEKKEPIILKINAKSNLYTSGLRKGDKVLHIDNHPVNTVSRLIGLIRSYPAHSVVEIEVLRNNEKIKIQPILDLLPITGKANLEITFYPSKKSTTNDIQALEIKNVTENSPASEAGLQVGDIVTSFAGTKITSRLAQRFPQYLESIFSLYSRSTGALVEITIIRDGEEKNLIVEIKPGTPKMGATVAKNTSTSAPEVNQEQQEVTILEVQENMFAARGGLQRGDVILGINNYSVKSLKIYHRTIAKLQPGEKVTVKVLREGKEKSLEVVLGLKRNYFGGY